MIQRVSFRRPPDNKLEIEQREYADTIFVIFKVVFCVFIFCVFLFFVIQVWSFFQNQVLVSVLGQVAPKIR